MRTYQWTAICSAAFLVAAAAVLGAAERRVKIESLPAPVQDAIRAQLSNATLVAVTSEKEDGKTVYEAETKVAGRTRDVTMDSSGAVLAIEEEVGIDSIPAAARAAIERAAAGGRITKVETISKGKAPVYYEAAIARKGKTTEVTVGADGSAVK